MKAFELVVLPEEAADEQKVEKAFFQQHKLQGTLRIAKRSIDARARQVKIRLQVELYGAGETIPVFQKRKWQNVADAKPVLIAGCGPAGMFAAIKCIELGYKPVIIERGKNVRDRRRDLAAINKQHVVDPNSNYCFGEGGAGTYSDGKLYTRSTKRGNVLAALHTFIEHGADVDIAVDAHPHIGTNKLPGIITAMRENILACGGEILFETKLTDILVAENKVTGIEVEQLSNGSKYKLTADALILATGHSARDIFYLLHHKKINIEGKPFALGVRAEHNQQIIDASQYHCEVRSDFLPPAAYSLTHQHNGRGVYSFCMCPGGIIAPASTKPGEVVVNGWSPSRRNNPFANSGVVVSVMEDDVKRYSKHGELRFLEFQKEVEQKAFVAGGSNLKAPAQRMIDFVNEKKTIELPSCSYLPGITSVNLHEVLPAFIAEALADGFKSFGQKIKGYYTNEALLVGVESRTSSPVRIPRNKETAMHEQIEGLFPCAEGAGYAGGIISAALDGEFCAEQCANFIGTR